jgi:hypothetical protein
MSLDKLLDARKEILSRPGMGVNSPIIRRLEEVIKTAYGMPGREAVKLARLELSRVPGSKVNALIKREVQQPEVRQRPGKETGQARLQRLAAQQGEQFSNQLTPRQLRNQLRGVFQETPKLVAELEGSESVAVVNPPTGTDVLTPEEVNGIAVMAPKEIIDKFGPGRIDATLERMGEELKGSDRQRANRLKKLLTE